jgi:spoIIIJ-associated protein
MTDQDSTTMADQTNRPDQGQPDQGQPDQGQPDQGQPDQAQRDLAQPGAAQPGLTQPDLGQVGLRSEQPDQFQPPATAGAAATPDHRAGEDLGTAGATEGSPAAGDKAAGASEGDEAGAGGGAATSRAGQLEREGEVAADFLEQLLDIADMDGDIDVDVDGDRAAVAIVDSEEGRVSRRLVGPDGKVLDALQELTRLAVQAATGERSRLMLDVAGHRAERRSALVELARTVIAEVRATGEQQAMDPMTAFERKVVHDEVAAAGLESDSEGVEPHRHVVVLPG